MEKLLEDAQIKLSVVASDIFGVSGRDMMAALISGQREPTVLARMARGRMRAKITQLEEAFTGYFTDHHGLPLTKMLARVDALSADIAELESVIEKMIAPFATAVERLDEIHGIGPRAAAVVISEIGIDMSRFPTAGRSILVIIWHLLSDPEACFADLGADFYDKPIDPERRKRAHIHQLEALGYKVTLEPAAQPPTRQQDFTPTRLR